MIDSHCHFDLRAFDNNRKRIIANLQRLGLTKILVPGLSTEQFENLLRLKHQFPIIDIALGCHPYFLEQLNPTDLAKHMTLLAEMARVHSSTIVAIGECGLDASLALPMAYQERVLIAQIEIAKVERKPLILHHRQSHNALIRIIKHSKFTYGGVVHAFSGSFEIAQTYIELGFALGVGGTITYDRAKKTRETIKRVDLSHLLIETDAPDMPLNSYQGEPNTPERLPLVANALAMLKGFPVSMIEQQTNANYNAIFTPKKG